MNKEIKCSVYNCKHCDCECEECQLDEIKVCECGCDKEKKDTMCNSYEKKD